MAAAKTGLAVVKHAHGNHGRVFGHALEQDRLVDTPHNTRQGDWPQLVDRQWRWRDASLWDREDHRLVPATRDRPRPGAESKQAGYMRQEQTRPRQGFEDR